MAGPRQRRTPRGPECRTLVDLVTARAAEAPDKVLYTSLDDGGAIAATMTYRELDERARAVAAGLQRTIAAGDRVVIACPHGLEFVVGLIGAILAGAVAVPAYPPNKQRGRDRLLHVVQDSGARVVLTARATADPGTVAWAAPSAPAVATLDLETLSAAGAEQWRRPAVDGHTLAWLQYTSGSTGEPRGVMVSHGNVLHNEAQIQQAFRQHRDSVVVGWLPMYHDMGLIGIVLQPLYAQASAVLLSPAAFLRQPVRWLEAISRFRADTSGGPNFAYDLCASRITEADSEGLDLRHWRVAFNGAEPVRASTIARFSKRFAARGFRPESFFPCYGLAEASLLVAGGKPADRPAVTTIEQDGGAHALVGCGVPAGCEIAIVDPETQKPCAEGATGEIWVAGKSVAQGYWQRAADTVRTFRAQVRGRRPRFLRTGDLGRLAHGEVVVTGRIKDLIIVRGQNHHPHDVEQTVETATARLGMGAAAAFSIDPGDGERLVILQEVLPGASIDASAVMARIREQVSARHELAAYAIALLPAGALPRTSSGKLRRFLCREAFEQDRLAALASWTDAARGDAPIPVSAPAIDSSEAVCAWLRETMAARLGCRPDEIDERSRVSRWSIDSLEAVRLADAVETACSASIAPAAFLGDLTLAEIARRIWDTAEPPRSGDDVETGDPAGAHPLSFGQEGLWYLQQLDPAGATYNVANAVRGLSPIDAAALRRALGALAARHPALRTAFSLQAGTPVQRVLERIDLPLIEEDRAGEDEQHFAARLSAAAREPFDLGRAPLMRVHLYRRPAGEYVLLVVVHHIVADLWSLAVLVRDLGALYDAARAGREPSAASPGLDFVQHARRERARIAGDTGEPLWRYWQQALADVPGRLALPFDHTPVAPRTYACAIERFEIDADDTRQIAELAGARGTTLFTALLTCYEILLQRYTGQDRFLVGVPFAGRYRARAPETMGYFVNTLVIAADCTDRPDLLTLLDRTQRAVTGAIEHGEYPFPLLVERLHPDRTPGHAPLFQTMFALQSSSGLDASLAQLALRRPGVRFRLGELDVESVEILGPVSNFPVTMLIVERDGALHGSVEYHAELFEPGTMRQFARAFERVVRAVVRDARPIGETDGVPHRSIAALPLLTDEEEREQVVHWDHATRITRPEACLHELIAPRCEATPDRVAVGLDDVQLTYGALDERAERLAAALREAGIGRETIVAVCFERSLELVVAMLGILRAGGAWLPLDPMHPVERLRSMLEQARVPLVLTSAGLMARVPDGEWRVACVDRVGGLAEDLGGASRRGAGRDEHAASSPVMDARPGDLAYVLYTSGSTGRPKGAMNTHRAIVNRLLWMQEAYGLEAGDRVAQKTPVTFDVSVWEFFWPLITGACLVLAAPERHRDTSYLARWIRRQALTTVHFVPSMLNAFLADPGAARARSLRRVIASGEALSWETQQTFLSTMTATLHNLYGPTEAAVDVTAWTCRASETARTVPIGYPVANTRMYVMDDAGALAPAGTRGELAIAGVQVGRGYVHSPALTARAFVPDRFGPPGSRVYRTGDIGRYRADGSLEYLGRRDSQVKLRGVRIEPGEIERALVERAGARDAAVVLSPNGAGEPRLVAYVVPRSGANVSAATLRTALAPFLPDALIPSAFVTLAELPLSPHGKLDRQALPAWSADRAEADSAFVAPRTRLEETIADFWREALGVETIGIHDDFFELGGHSLLVPRVTSRIQDACGVDVPLRAFLDRPTIEGLADTVTQTLAAVR